MKKYLLLTMALAVTTQIHVQAQELKTFGNLLNKKGGIWNKSIIKGSAGYSFSKITFTDSTKAIKQYYRNAINLNVDINPYKDFYFKTNLYFDLTPSEIEPLWIADIFYQIGVYNWRKNTFSYGYENYGPNRFRNSPASFTDNLKRGHLFVKYKLEFSKEKPSGLFFDKTSKISIEPFFRVHPEYADSLQNAIGNGKIVAGSSFRYTVFKNIYLETALYFYPVSNSKLPWDPDYTYGFGIFDWRPMTVNFTYGNWISNRFPWNDKKVSNHGFMNGEFKLFINYAF